VTVTLTGYVVFGYSMTKIFGGDEEEKKVEETKQ
jgi:hypothetical protein